MLPLKIKFDITIAAIVGIAGLNQLFNLLNNQKNYF